MEKVRLILGGDVMLGRNVGHWIERKGAEYPLGKISPILKQADLVIINLECAITSSKVLWKGAPKAFYFGAPVKAADSLARAGIDIVSLANNHVLDFDYGGLESTLELLDEFAIGHAGAGRNNLEASSPVFAERNGITFKMAAFCDHQVDFSAGPSSPGINYVDFSDEKAALSRFHEMLEEMGSVDWPMLSVHWGPNMINRPSRQFRKLARSVIDMGYGVLYGHSPHVFQGVEIYKGRPILYACGDLVDDYCVDSEFMNDRQLLFELELARTRLEKIRIHPICIEDCRAIPAVGAQHEFVASRIASLCREMGTEVVRNAAGFPEIVPG